MTSLASRRVHDHHVYSKKPLRTVPSVSLLLLCAQSMCVRVFQCEWLVLHFPLYRTVARRSSLCMVGHYCKGVITTTASMAIFRRAVMHEK